MSVSVPEIVAEYTRDLTSAELNMELLRRAIVRTDKAIQVDEIACANMRRKLADTAVRLNGMRDRQIARQRELARRLSAPSTINSPTIDQAHRQPPGGNGGAERNSETTQD